MFYSSKFPKRWKNATNLTNVAGVMRGMHIKIYVGGEMREGKGGGCSTKVFFAFSYNLRQR